MQGIKQRVIVLSAQKYQVKDEKTGELKRGTSVRYVLSSDMSQTQDDSLKGLKLVKGSCQYDDFDSVFRVVPGIYDAELGFRIDSDGNAKLQAQRFEFVSAILLTQPKGEK